MIYREREREILCDLQRDREKSYVIERERERKRERVSKLVFYAQSTGAVISGR